MKIGGEFGIASKISLLKDLAARLSPRWGLSAFTLPHGLPRAEKLVEDARSLPQALKRLHIFSDLAARLKSGPSQNLREIIFFPQPVASLRQAQGRLWAAFLRRFAARSRART